MKKIWVILLLLIVITNITFAKKITCNNEQYNITIEIEKETLKIGETTLIAPNSEYNYEIKYRVSNTDIVKISDTGLVTGLKDGNTLVTVDVNFLEDYQAVTSCR